MKSVKLVFREKGSEIDIQISEGNKSNSSPQKILKISIFVVFFIIATLGSSAIYGAASGDYVIFNGIVDVTKSLIAFTPAGMDKK